MITEFGVGVLRLSSAGCVLHGGHNGGHTCLGVSERHVLCRSPRRVV